VPALRRFGVDRQRASLAPRRSFPRADGRAARTGPRP